MTGYNQDEIKRAINLLHGNGEVFEIRILDAGPQGRDTYSGYFTKAEDVLANLAKVPEGPNTQCYITLQVLKDEHMSKRQGGKLVKALKGDSTNDNGATDYKWLLLDFDPERLAGISSNQEELEKAHQAARAAYDGLKAEGWEEPIIALSGNGYHMLYRVDFKREEQPLFEKVLNGIADKYSIPGAKVDTTTGNPSRISKLYGTTARKGNNTEDRPHRQARILKAPDEIKATPREKLLAILPAEAPAEEAQKPSSSASKQTQQSASQSAFDVETWMDEHGVEHGQAEPFDGGTRWILDHCPFDSSHTGTAAAVIKTRSGSLAYKCQHDSCRNKQWKDFRAFYDDFYRGQQEYLKRRQQTPVQIHQAVQVTPPPAEEPKSQEEQLEEYLNANQTARYLQEFINGISASVNTPCIPTGFSQLDSWLDGGLYPGLYVLGAVSSSGKTSFILQIADQIAQSGQDVLYFSLEMAKGELISKSISRHTLLLCQERGIATTNAKTTRGIMDGKRYINYSQTEQDVIKSAITAYSSYAEHIYIQEGVGNIGADQIRETIKKHMDLTGRRPVIIVDYLQILAPANERATDKQNMDKAILELKRISRDAQTPVLIISSLNRTGYKGAVTMEDFKESGAIEYSADVLMGYQFASADNEATYNATNARAEEKKEMTIRILKQRNGRTMRSGEGIKLNFYSMFNYFMEE